MCRLCLGDGDHVFNICTHPRKENRQLRWVYMYVHANRFELGASVVSPVWKAGHLCLPVVPTCAAHRAHAQWSHAVAVPLGGLAAALRGDTSYVVGLRCESLPFNEVQTCRALLFKQYIHGRNTSGVESDAVRSCGIQLKSAMRRLDVSGCFAAVIRFCS
eukprot:gnl/TRDRNA2_/TRDRNA2_32548_c0_seq1.p2 gnl/TRDRNA2_/TRDRNA2_32548_c0~~gnl/TRDRNA2_/TRDRNA2_32548_c0_seq1.p2  ORF type:complete len:160 (-),score=11.36 gnl/TRDRNA2_/TRDRNA2_32548_c0_seq1:84-563(-)